MWRCVKVNKKEQKDLKNTDNLGKESDERPKHLDQAPDPNGRDAGQFDSDLEDLM